MASESYSVVVFTAIAILFFTMHVQMKVIVACIRHKPAVLITLRDLVRCDLALAYQLSVSAQSAGVTAILIQTPENFRNCLGLLSALSMSFFGMCFSAYVGIGALVDYTMAKCRTAGPLEDYLTDEKAINLIRTFVCLSAFSLCIISIFLGDIERALPVLATMRDNKDINWIDDGMPISLQIITQLLTISLITNVILRTLIMIEKRKNDQVLGLLSNTSQFAPSTYVAYISVCLMIMFASLPLRFYQFQVRAMAHLFITCVVAPATIILSNKPLRKFVLKGFGF